MKRHITIAGTLVLLVLISACKKEDEQQVNGVYMNMKPTKTPVLLAPGLLASSLDEYNGTFSPDGKEFFFTTNTPSKGIISKTTLGEDGKWAKATIAPFSGIYSEYDPLFSPDGNSLYFTSERPVDTTAPYGKTHIWYVEKQNAAWSQPKLLELEKQGVYYSSITQNGTIYFNIWDTGDMYKANKTGTGYEIEKLSEILNTKNGEGDPFISPEEDYLIFRGYNNSLGLGDLYISYKIGENWTAPENLGEPINSRYHEMCPYVTVDGKYFIFASSRIEKEYPSKANNNLAETRKKHHTVDNGKLNIYYISADFIKEKRKKYE